LTPAHGERAALAEINFVAVEREDVLFRQARSSAAASRASLNLRESVRSGVR
jgi:hypothetical protein